MIKIMFFSFPGYSHEVPSFELLNRLSRNSEIKIYYFTKSDNNFIKLLENNIQIIDYGIDFESNSSSYVKEENINDVNEILINFHMLSKFILDKMEQMIAMLSEQVEKINPDLVMYDSFAHWGRKLAEKFNIKTISSIAIYPYDKEVINQDDKYFLKNYININNKFNKLKKSRERILDILKDKLYEQSGSSEKNPYKFFINYGDLNVSYSSKEVQTYGNKFNDKFHFVGRSVKINNKDLNYYKNILDTSLPIVYICLGTVFNNNILFYEKCINAFKNSNMQIVISIGKALNKKDLGKIPDNFIIESFLPQIEILKLSDVFITQGGFNAVNEALIFNVPMLLFPQALDQYTIAYCMEKLKAGIYIRNKKISVNKIKKLTIKLIKQKKYRNNCEKISKTLMPLNKYDVAIKNIMLLSKNI